MVIYLREKYSHKIPPYLIQSLDNLRRERHENLYGLEFIVEEKDAEIGIKDAEQFIKIVKEILLA